MYAAFYKVTRPGLQGVYSKAVQFIDRGAYSHCQLVFTDGMSASASWMDNGVRFKRIDYNPEHWDFVQLPDHLEDFARSWFEFHEGMPYDLQGNVRFVLPFLPDSTSGWFCSEAIAAALQLYEPYRFGPNGLAAILKSLYQREPNDLLLSYPTSIL